MAADIAVVTITHAIQQAVAPVFLLAGIGAILNVLAGRLARIIDRSRALHSRLESATGDRAAGMRDELVILTRRARVVNRAIAFGTISSLLVCVVIALLFISALGEWQVGMTVVGLFVAAMACLIISLISFLREIQLAMRVILNGP
ncbi:MAG: DUF2721 domain-containing protein [Spongiibacter sp.]|uniref:DUF2721 domain-containing protein n=1 Tax=Spongiibacter thalassae TaxID=2721624 RepID=A0ABX1GEM0_9GAMM|nr:DUF2721 domain-containing protein [Spongiibacter thalassae]MDX1505124.1 DUF2721 domain-containing protein [Spongiibacter sp.]NKI17642.1 DUF2721 domain-containing protein [Spongiibacter thalassae]